MKQFIYATFICLLSVITACSSGSDKANKAPAQLSGALDIPIAGLPYKTESQSGITSESGEFSYLEGESITFYLGLTEFGRTKAGKQLAFSDIVLIPFNSNETEQQYSASQLPAEDNPASKPGYLYSVEELREILYAPKVTQQLKLINQLRLLWSIDEDNNASNGITISETSRIAFERVSLSFEQLSELFAYDTLSILNSLDKTLFTPTATIAVTYKSLDIQLFRDRSYESYLSFPNFFEEDANGDGVYERRSQYDYDSYNNLVGYSLDIDGDNTYEAVRQASFQEAGQKLSISTSRNGTLRFYETRSYDAIGRPVQYEYDANGDGTIDDTRSTVYKQENSSFITEQDYDSDGAVDTRYLTQYDDLGRKIVTSSTLVELGVTTSQTEYSYNETGRVEKTQTDGNTDGIFDEITLSSYDVDDNIILLETDNNADGNIDRTETSSYDSSGNLLQKLKDDNNDGSPDYVETYTYDYAGRKLTFTTDVGNNGIDHSETFTYSSTGKIISWVSEEFGAYANIVTKSYTYNDYGLLMSYEYRSAQNATANYVLHYEYQDKRYISRIETDLGIDQSIDAIKTQAFDSKGNIIAITHDFENDGVIDYSANIGWQGSNQIDTFFEIVDSILTSGYLWSETELDLLFYRQ